MSEQPQISVARKGRPRQRKSDGQDGPPQMAPLRPELGGPAPVNTAGAPNAALQEPAPTAEQGYDPNHPCAAHLVVRDVERGVLGMSDGTPRRQKIAICGFASSTRPYILEISKDPTWEIWVLNQLYRHLPRADVEFDIHCNWDQECVPGTDHRNWARTCGIPFYMYKREPDIATSVRYPIETMVQHHEADYFTSTPAYMLALAIWDIDGRVWARFAHTLGRMTKGQLAAECVPLLLRRLYAEYEIGMFGIDLVVGQEYTDERPCAEYWVGQASARGILIRIPRESALCKAINGRYGYDPAAQTLLRLKEFKDHQAAMTKERDELMKRLLMFEGALLDDQYWQDKLELRMRGVTV